MGSRRHPLEGETIKGTRTSGLSRTRWFDATVAAAVALVLSLPVLGYPLLHLSVPWGAGDLLAHYVSADAWAPLGFPASTHYGYPAGMDLAYMPTIDWTQNAFAWVVQSITGSPFTGLNLLLVLSFPITAALAVIAFRLVGLHGPIAIALAVSYTFIPYHFDRGLSHLYPATMYAGVTGVLLALLIGTDRIPRSRKPITPLVGIAFLMFVSAWSGMYYAAFAIIFTTTAVIWRWIRRDSAGRIVRLAAIPLGIAILTIIAFLPGALRFLTDPPLLNLVTRSAADSVTFAGNLAQLLTPYPGLDLPISSQLASTIEESQAALASPSESAVAGFGTLVTTLGFAVFIIGWVVLTRRTQRTPLPLIGLLFSVGVLFFVPWGAGYLFASLISPQVRAWGRLTPLLLLIILIGTAAVLVRTRASLRPWRSSLAWAITAAILVATLIAQVLPFRTVYSTAVDQGRFVQGEVVEYAKAVNAVIPQRCGILQLPYMAFPENGIREPGLNDYEHAWHALVNRGKYFSYGAVKGTQESVLTASLTDPPSRSQLDRLKEAGFCAIHLDKRGYTDVAWQRVTTTLTTDLGEHVAAGLDGAWLTYGL